MARVRRVGASLSHVRGHIGLAWVFGVAAGIVPIAAALVGAWPGWVPEGDSAVIALRARDVLTDTPLVGMPTTFGRESGAPAHHPGPAQFFLLAPLEAVWQGRHAPLVSTVVVNLASVAAVVLAAVRRSRIGAVATGLGLGVVLWPLRGEILVEPFNPYAAFLPLVACMAATVVMTIGDVKWAPVAVVAGSVAVQAHVSTSVVVAALGLLAGGSLVRNRGRVGRRLVVVTVATGVVVWIPPLLDQVFGLGNLHRLVVAARGDPSSDGTLGAVGALRVVVNAIGPVPVAVRGAMPDAAGLLRVPPPAAWAVAAGIVALSFFVIGLGRRGERALCASGVAALAGGAFGTSRVPVEFFNAYAPHNYLWLWPATGAITAGIGLALWRRPAARTLAVAAAGGAVLLAAQAPLPIPNGQMRSAVVPVADEVRAALDGDKRYLLHLTEDIPTYSVEAGLFRELDRAGVHVVVPPAYEPAFGRHRTARQVAVDGELRVLVRHSRPPRGADVIAELPPDPAANRTLWVRVELQPPGGSGTRNGALSAPFLVPERAS